MSPFISNLSSSTSLGTTLSFNFGYKLWACYYANGADVGTRQAFTSPLSGSIDVSLTAPVTPGIYTRRVYDAQSGGNLVAESAPQTITAAQAVETGTLSGVPAAGSATVPLTGGTYALQNGTSAYVGLYNVTTGAYESSLVALSGASGSLPSFTPAAQATYAYKLASDSAGANVLATSGNITVGAAPDIVLTGLPSSIAAGQPLSGVTFVTNNGAYGDLVLYDHTAGSQETTVQIANTVTPDNTLGFLVPQVAGHSYTVRLVSTDGSNTLIWESASFGATAALGTLPAQVSGFTTSGATTTQVTLSWSAASGATGYQVLAKTGYGTKWGSLANTVVNGTSYTFTGLAAGNTFFPVVTAINANGRGPSVGTIASTASS